MYSFYEQGLKIYKKTEKIEKRKCSGIIKDYICKQESKIKGAMAGIRYIQSVKCPQYKNPKTTKRCIDAMKHQIMDWKDDIKILQDRIKKYRVKHKK
jgi:hypothetical protein